ncbi:DNA phosphorothioation-associated putative methyltransferase [Endozoicomonas sp. SCSIO W0465]|uniref:DNA phosphorothioation-associated putative methyltransferase n=1 Tax=Endozoicomonas sp. SCSIO W0465 TaxID=2918516 RepID=UPI0020760F5D|nr:DNA phosphorothioation-associated putative methyltransferase [Endozoicomonas sp. SCSIO W0465]USE35845.1 DNA phosphorothioation-associated putative methyltransferase [Endozoicomonas sp. SCSIO W0465]
MTPEIFQAHVKELKYGKKLPGAVYLHKSTFHKEAAELGRWISLKLEVLGQNVPWTVIKLQTRGFGVSLLNYPDFYEEAYPALHSSLSLDFERERYKHNKFSGINPPILHRKETMVAPDDPYYEEFCNITREGEEAGLYDNAKIIGFRQTWESLIHERGYELVDGRLFRSSSVVQTEQKIERHRTALSRDALSSPMKTLAKQGYLEGEFSLFDYGCGRGDDLCELEAHGLSASGWDPNWRPDGEKVSADLVNIGYVINVIEDLEERVDALLGAWRLTKKLLVVSAMIAGEEHIKKFKRYKDGVITSRNTFQKYYTQSELQHFIEHIVEEEPIAVAPGIFYIFKDKDEEQLYLANKQRRVSHHWKQLTQKPVKVPRSEILFVEHGQLLEQFWVSCLDYGRLPAVDEFSQYEQVKALVGSPKKAFRILCERYEIDDFEKAENDRREDLLIYFALQQFCKRKPYRHMPEKLKRDIKAFFGDYKNSQAQAQSLLFSLGEMNAIEQACQLAHEQLPASILNEGHSLVIHSRFVNDLPPALRLYIGCATMLYGDVSDVNLIKVHIRSGKLTLMKYEGFDHKPIPLLQQRIKINLRKQEIDFFDYAAGLYSPQPLYWKSKLIDESFADYSKQKSFDKKLLSLDLPDMDGYGLDYDTFTEVMKHGYNLEVKGYRFYKVNKDCEDLY